VLTSLAGLRGSGNLLYCLQVVGKEHTEVLSPVLTSLAELHVLADFLYFAQVVGKKHPEVLSPVLTSLAELLFWPTFFIACRWWVRNTLRS
jgi:hypothetical protein